MKQLETLVTKSDHVAYMQSTTAIRDTSDADREQNALGRKTDAI